ncbi:MAG: T9SS type A sorting domain-containing protein [Paludibacteraceae bacterium]|nr:T9SS type A sorting domain-containing protein [Paludibacteraceae bacterium]
MKKILLSFALAAVAVSGAFASYQYNLIGDVSYDIKGKQNVTLDLGSDVFISAVDFDVKSSSTFLVTNPLVMKIGGTIVYKAEPTTKFERVSYKFETPQVGSTISIENRANVTRSVKNMTFTLESTVIDLGTSLSGDTIATSFVVLSDTALAVDNFVSDNERLTIDSVSNNASIYRVYVSFAPVEIGENIANVSLVNSQEDSFVVAEVKDRVVLPATTIVVADPTYTTVDFRWLPVGEAKGYEIACSNGTSIDVDDANAVFAGLEPNTTYEFKISAIDSTDYVSPYYLSINVTTLASKCDGVVFGDITLNGNDTRSIIIDKNTPVISFSYESTGTIVKSCGLEQLIDGEWVSLWSSNSDNGVATVNAINNHEGSVEVRFVHSAWFDSGKATFTNINAFQGLFVTPQTTEIDLGEIVYEEGMIVNYDLAVDYASMWATIEGSEDIAVDKDSIGGDGCDFGTDTLSLSIIPESEGLFEGSIYVGATQVVVRASFVVVPVSAPSVAADSFEVTPNPASDYATVNAADVVEVYLYDLAGKLLTSAQGNTVDMANLAPATYSLVAKFADGSLKSANVIKK